MYLLSNLRSKTLQITFNLLEPFSSNSNFQNSFFFFLFPSIYWSMASLAIWFFKLETLRSFLPFVSSFSTATWLFGPIDSALWVGSCLQPLLSILLSAFLVQVCTLLALKFFLTLMCLLHCL